MERLNNFKEKLTRPAQFQLEKINQARQMNRKLDRIANLLQDIKKELEELNGK